MKQKEINKVWAEDTENIKTSTDEELADGINYGSQLQSDEMNEALNILSTNAQFILGTGGYYNNFQKYFEGNVITIYWATEFGLHQKYELIRQALNSGISGVLPILNATTEEKDGVTFFRGGIINIEHWHVLETKSVEEHLLGVTQTYRDSEEQVIDPAITNSNSDSIVINLSSAHNRRIRIEPNITINDGNAYTVTCHINMDLNNGDKVLLDVLFKAFIALDNQTTNISYITFKVLVDGDTIPLFDYRDNAVEGSYRVFQINYEMRGWYEVVIASDKNRLMKL